MQLHATLVCVYNIYDYQSPHNIWKYVEIIAKDESFMCLEQH